MNKFIQINIFLLVFVALHAHNVWAPVADVMPSAIAGGSKMDVHLELGVVGKKDLKKP